MKSQLVMLFLVAFISSNAFAITGKDRWEVIEKSVDVVVLQPSFAQAFGPRGIFNICYTADEFKSKSPVKNCISFREDNSCEEYEHINVSLNRAYIQNACTRHAPMYQNSAGDCVERANVTAFYPTSLQLAVVEAYGSVAGQLIFSKSYAISPCQ